jgi:anthranilate synthase component 1
VLYDGPPGARSPAAATVIRSRAVRELLQAIGRSRARSAALRRRFVGYLSYDIVRTLRALAEQRARRSRHPDLYLMWSDTLVVFDNVAMSMKVVSHAPGRARTDLRRAYDTACARVDDLVDRFGAAGPTCRRRSRVDGPPAVCSNFQPTAYQAIVERAKEYIRAGDVIQVVLAQRFECPLRADPFNIYRCLRTFNPSPYMFFLRVGPRTVLGASPEVMVRLEGRELTVRPIAGTRPRGTDEREDRELERELCADPKEIAEHIMLVDLGRNDVGRVSRIGSVEVTARMVVERYSYVMHLVSNVRGELGRRLDCFRRLSRHLPGRHAVGCAEDPRHGDHRGARARAARACTAARSATSISRATWTRRSPSAPW